MQRTVSPLVPMTTKPLQLQINRGASWPSAQREVGDGMEATGFDKPLSIISNYLPAASQGKNLSYPSASNSVSEACSVHSSRTTSPTPTSKHHEVVEQQWRSHYLNKKGVYASFSTPPTRASSLPYNSSQQCLIEEKDALKDHLQIQIQVNQELKRLLVASVGEDLGYHYDRLSTEKAQLSLEIDELQKVLQTSKEEIERLEISCDVWRSKFQASRVQCDELSSWRRCHERQIREMESGVRGLLREHWERSEHLENIFKTLSHLKATIHQEKQDTHSRTVKLRNDVSSTLVEKCRKLASIVSSQILGENAITFKNEKSDDVPMPTPAEKYVLQLLSEHQKASNADSSNQTLPGKPMSPVRKHHFAEYKLDRAISRLHCHAGSENVTINCCTHCKGDIHVV